MSLAGLGTTDTPPVQAGRGGVSVLLRRPVVFGSLIPAVTALNAAVGLLLPALMWPAEFGTYSLVVTLFQYGLIFDGGASQLADRRIPALLGRGEAVLAERSAQELLWLRFAIGAALLAVAVPAMLALRAAAALPFGLVPGLLSAVAGIAYMLALGPACVHRARSERRQYALSIALLSSGLVVARPCGFLLGGLDGCFAALAAWYVGFTVLLNGRMPARRAQRPGTGRYLALFAAGLPFFATSFLWAFYLTGNRWFASGLIPAAAFGEFAFGANIASLLVGSAAGFSAFYYPRLCARIAGGNAGSQSARFCRDCLRLLFAATAVVAVGIVLAAVLVGLVYPRYAAAVPIARVMLVSVPPLVLASWLMPVSLSSGRSAWVDGLVVFPLATAVLGLAVHQLWAAHGSEGAAAASTVAALPLVAMQLAVLVHARVLRAAHAATLLAASCACAAGLAALVLALALAS